VESGSRCGLKSSGGALEADWTLRDPLLPFAFKEEEEEGEATPTG